MKQKPRIPDVIKTGGRRCARCNVAGEKLIPDPSGRMICQECEAVEYSKYYRNAEDQRDAYLNRYWPNGTPPTPTTDNEPWHITHKAATGGLSPDAAYLNSIIMEQREMIKMLHSQIGQAFKDMRLHMTERLSELESQIHEQSETIKDLIEELSE